MRGLMVIDMYFRQGKIESGALIDCALGPGSSAMAVNNPADTGKANARAFKLDGAMEALKNAEQFFNIPHVEPDAVVTNENYKFVGGGAGADLNPGGLASAGVFK